MIRNIGLFLLGSSPFLRNMMKPFHFNIYAVALLLCFSVVMTACKDTHKVVEPKEGPAHLMIQPAEWKAGYIPQGSGVIEKEFAMINDGSEDLVITKIENLCSCTTTEFVDKPIVPGHGRALKIKLDTNHLTPGEFSRTVIVNSNGGQIVIDITGVKNN